MVAVEVKNFYGIRAAFHGLNGGLMATGAFEILTHGLGCRQEESSQKYDLEVTVFN